MSDTRDITERLADEADLCRNEGADDIAALLDDARGYINAREADIHALQNAARMERDALRAEVARLTGEADRMTAEAQREWRRAEEQRERAERAEAERDALLMQARCWSHEAKAQRATVHECYRACTGGTGEPGDWNGAEPVRRLVAERDRMRAALIRARDWLPHHEPEHPDYDGARSDAGRAVRLALDPECGCTPPEAER